MAKGAFVIRGKRNWNRNLEVNLSIGLIEYDGIEKLMGGPVESFQGKSKKYVTFKPGFVDRKIVSKKLQNVYSGFLILFLVFLYSKAWDSLFNTQIDSVLQKYQY